MIMNHSPDQFERLKLLLGLKRHEQPPPGYFAHFSDKVIAQIEAEAIRARASWWHRWLPEFGARPVLAFAYGLAITGFVIVGIGISQSLDLNTDQPSTPGLEGTWSAAPAAPLSANATITPSPVQAANLFGAPQPASSSVDPVISPGAPAFLFDVNRVNADRASYNFR